LILFDGLNRFYVRAESPELLERASSPACVFDDFVDASQLGREAELATQIAAQAHELAELRTRTADLSRFAECLAAMESLAAALADAEDRAAHADGLREDVMRWRRELRITQDQLARAEDESVRRGLAAEAMRERLARERAALAGALDQATRELDALRATRILRWTARPRRLYGALRRLHL
jgi:hypothetical protein